MNPFKEIFDLVLIDDDDLVRMAWKFRAGELELKIKLFADCESFEKAEVDLLTPVFVDLNLGNNVYGIDVLKDLHSRGYVHLYLATGERNVNGAPAFLKGIGGKEFPEFLFRL